MADDLSFEERLSALEASIGPVAGYTLPDLQKQLERHWQPNGSDFVQPGSLTPDAFDRPYLSGRAGQVTFTFAGGNYSSVMTVPHGLGKTPQLVLVTNQFVAGVVTVTGTSANWTATNFLAAGMSDVAFTGTITHAWIALN